MKSRGLTGAMGESMAAAHYRKNGLEIIGVNYRTRHGEIDIIARKQCTIVFCEVKTRTANAIADASEFVTSTKQRRVILAAQEYISSMGLNENNYNFRFDVVAINIDKTGNNTLNCIENAFTL